MLLIVFAYVPAPSYCDKVILKSGKIIDGWIMREDDNSLTINTGFSEISFSKSEVKEIKREISMILLRDEVHDTLNRGKRLRKAGHDKDAKQLFEHQKSRLEDLFDRYDDIPSEAEELKTRIEEELKKIAPPDPVNQKTEKLYNQALQALDEVRYQEAYRILKQAVEVGAERPEVYYRLGEVSKQIGRTGTAVEAYEKVLQIDPGHYYERVAPVLVNQMEKHGNELLEKGDEKGALQCFKHYLVLRDEDESGVRGVEEWKTFSKTFENLPEKEKFMRIFRFADNDDRINLAHAAIKRVSEIDPEDAQVQRLLEETAFLDEYKKLINEGKLNEARVLKKGAAEEILSSDRVSRRLNTLLHRLPAEIRAENMLARAEELFLDKKYGEAAELLEDLKNKYPGKYPEEDVEDLLFKARLEKDVTEALTKSTDLIDRGLVDEAEKVLLKIFKRKDVQKSDFWPELQFRASLTGREKKAIEEWKKVINLIEEGNYNRAFVEMETIAGKFRGARTAEAISEWLSDNRLSYIRQARIKSLRESGMMLSLAVPALPIPENQELGDEEWEIFSSVLRGERRNISRKGSQAMHWGVPLVIGLIVSIVIIIKWIPPGSASFAHAKEMDKRRKGLHADEETCRYCGWALAKGLETCPFCGYSVEMTDVERIRNKHLQEDSNFDPWDIRVSEEKENNFDILYEKSVECLKKKRYEDALELAKEACREDPHKMKGLKLLASLYENMNKQGELAVCYHRMLMIDPEDREVNNKLKDLESPLTGTPLRPLYGVIVLSLSFWWMVFWLSAGFNPGFMLFRGILCGAGFVITTSLWIVSQKTKKIKVKKKPRSAPGFQYPVSLRPLSWRGLNKQAKKIALMIRDHTGVNVPAVTTGRMIFSVALSFLMLCVFVLLSWRLGNYWILVGWLGVPVLLIYLLNIHPLAFTAHVLLRHLYEETHSPWADPEIPFKPRGKKAKAEFNLKSLDRFPLKWSHNPTPYRNNLQGALNSLLQTLDRHWRCHCFYEHLHVNRDYEMPVPGGFRAMSFMTILVCILAILGGLFVWSFGDFQKAAYRRDMREGYEKLVHGKVYEAEEHFAEAARSPKAGFVPDLYLGVCYHKRSLPGLAAPRLRSAIRKAPENKAVLNEYGKFLYETGDEKEALKVFGNLITMYSENPCILNNIGSTCYALGKYDSAVSYLDSAIDYDPDHNCAYTTLGLTYEKMDQKEKAEDSYRKAVSHAPDYPYTKVAKMRLEDKLESLNEAVSPREIFSGIGS